jgi:hypothetical protein
MPAENTYKLGDIVRWRDSKIIGSHEYGMVIKKPEIVSGGTYKFVNEIVEMFDVSDSSYIKTEPIISLTVFSFGEQRVITLYRNPEDIPYQIEKVDFIEKSS